MSERIVREDAVLVLEPFIEVRKQPGVGMDWNRAVAFDQKARNVGRIFLD